MTGFEIALALSVSANLVLSWTYYKQLQEYKEVTQILEAFIMQEIKAHIINVHGGDEGLQEAMKTINEIEKENLH